MKFICTQENLSRALFIVSRCVGKNPSLPILSNVLLKTTAGRIQTATTNLEIGITYFFGGKIEKEGQITIPARLLTDYVSNLPPTKISLSTKKTKLLLECNSYQAEIKGIDASEFPLIPKIKEKPFCFVRGADFKKALNQVVFAAALEETRPEIAGVHLGLVNSLLKIAATDSYRLAEKSLETQKSQGDLDVIVPAKTMQELARILSEDIENVAISTSENQIKFEFGEIELISRLVEGKYPDYEQIIPKNFSCQTQVNAYELEQALRTTSLFSKKGSNEIKVELSPKNNEIILSAESDEVGKNITKLKATISGKPERVIFNYRYLLDGLTCIETPQIVLQTSGDVGPGLITPADSKDYLYLVMPIKQ